MSGPHIGRHADPHPAAATRAPGGTFEAARAGSRAALRAAILITVCVLAVELVGGWVANSLALLSDAGHVFTDALALLLSYTALVVSERAPNSRKSYGYYRVEILAALFNGALLIVLSLGILRESWLRLTTPEAVAGAPMLVTAVAGLAGNIAAMVVLSRARANLNLRSAFLHVLGDALSSVGVVGAGIVVMVTGWNGADAVAGAIIGVVIVVGAVRLLRESVDILLEACPGGIDGDRVAARIRSLPEVAAVHDLHIWSITSDMHALSGHVVLRPGAAAGDEILGRLQEMLRDEFQVAHTTFQIETHAFEEIGHVH